MSLNKEISTSRDSIVVKEGKEVKGKRGVEL